MGRTGGKVGAVAPRKGRVSSADLTRKAEIVKSSTEGVSTSVESGGGLVARLAGVSTERHLPLAKIYGKLGARYRVGFEARTSEGWPGGRLGLIANSARY